MGSGARLETLLSGQKASPMNLASKRACTIYVGSIHLFVVVIEFFERKAVKRYRQHRPSCAVQNKCEWLEIPLGTAPVKTLTQQSE